MSIHESEISDDLEVGLLVLALAADVAPILTSETLPDDVRRDQAVVILRRVAADMPAPGMGRVSQQSRNGTSVSMREAGSSFSAEYRSALRALYGGVSPAAAPVGSFPESGLVAEMWPER